MAHSPLASASAIVTQGSQASSATPPPAKCLVAGALLEV